MHILGIDPGYDRMGVAIIDFNYKLRRINAIVKLGVIRTTTKDNFSDQLVELWNDLNELFTRYDIKIVGVENVVSITRSRRLAKVAEVTGVAKLSASLKGFAVVELFPAQIKKLVTGRGNASKDLVRRALKALLPDKELPHNIFDDTVDSIAIAYAAGLTFCIRYN